MGRWEGQKKTIIIKQFPEFFYNGKFIVKLTPIGGGEKYVDFRNRLIFFIHTIKELLKENYFLISY